MCHIILESQFRALQLLTNQHPEKSQTKKSTFEVGTINQGCHADVFGRTDGRSDDGRGGVRDLDALERPF
jgi:hypothetical protein